MRRLVALEVGLALAAVLLSACGENDPPPTMTPPPDAGATGACLDRPTDFARPPTDTLPCDLSPPGFVPKGD